MINHLKFRKFKIITMQNIQKQTQNVLYNNDEKQKKMSISQIPVTKNNMKIIEIIQVTFKI